MRNQNGGSRTDTLIKLVLIFFISLLSFSVGTFVGKNFSDSKYKQAQLEGEFDGAARDTASIPNDNLEVKPEEVLTEKDIDQIANEFSKPESINESTGREVASAESLEGNTHHDAATSHETHAEAIGADKSNLEHAMAQHQARVPNEVSKAAANVAAGNAPGDAKKEVYDPRSKELPTGVASSTVGKFTVQISSSLKQEEAEGEAQKLIAKGFSAFVVAADVNGKTWYRVSVGLFEKRAEAQAYRTQLMKEAGVTTAIVQAISRAPASN